VTRIKDKRSECAITDSDHLDATRSILNKYGELWFNGKS